METIYYLLFLLLSILTFLFYLFSNSLNCWPMARKNGQLNPKQSVNSNELKGLLAS